MRSVRTWWVTLFCFLVPCFGVEAKRMFDWAAAGGDADGVDWGIEIRWRKGRPLDAAERARIAKLGTLPMEQLVNKAGELIQSQNCPDINPTASTGCRNQQARPWVFVSQIVLPKALAQTH